VSKDCGANSEGKREAVAVEQFRLGLLSFASRRIEPTAAIELVVRGEQGPGTAEPKWAKLCDAIPVPTVQRGGWLQCPRRRILLLLLSLLSSDSRPRRKTESNNQFLAANAPPPPRPASSPPASSTQSC
jgi:hypothetical protein